MTPYSPAAAAAKWLQSCPTLHDPIDSSPSGSPIPGILQARTLEWVAISFSNAGKWKVKVKSLSRVPLFETLWTAAHQAPPPMGPSRQEYWTGVPLPSPPYSPGFYFIGLCFLNHLHGLCLLLYLNAKGMSIPRLCLGLPFFLYVCSFSQLTSFSTMALNMICMLMTSISLCSAVASLLSSRLNIQVPIWHLHTDFK